MRWRARANGRLRRGRAGRLAPPPAARQPKEAARTGARPRPAGQCTESLRRAVQIATGQAARLSLGQRQDRGRPTSVGRPRLVSEPSSQDPMNEIITAIILRIVEGLTAFLPVSSTGHLILATELLGYDASRWAIFNIAIQPGAILAIVVLYRKLFREMFTGFFRRDPVAIAFLRNLALAFVPAVALRLAPGDYIEVLLANAGGVAWARR